MSVEPCSVCEDVNDENITLRDQVDSLNAEVKRLRDMNRTLTDQHTATPDNRCFNCEHLTDEVTRLLNMNRALTDEVKELKEAIDTGVYNVRQELDEMLKLI